MATKVSDLHLARAAEVMKLAYGVGISTDQSRALVAAKLAEWDKPRAVAKELFGYLDTTEESDGGREFHPVHLSCCRAAWVDDLNRVMTELKATTLVS